MKIEHFAFNVEDPIAMSEWYIKNMGMTLISQVKEPPYPTFLADNSGRVMIEIYKNPPHEIPDYRNMNTLILHLAFVSEQPSADKDRLLKVGAKVVKDEVLDDGSQIVTLRDPWGFAIQLCKRGKQMLTDMEL